VNAPNANPRLAVGQKLGKYVLKEKLGDEVLAKLGQTRPTVEQEAQIRTCLAPIKSEGSQMPSAPMNSVLPMPPIQEGDRSSGVLSLSWVSRLPLTVQTCLQEKYGVEKLGVISRMPPTPEVEQVMKACFSASGGMPSTSGVMTPPPPLPTGSIVPSTMDGTAIPQVPMLPPQPVETTAPQSRSFTEQFLGAVASPFVRLWEAL
jgi:hypothetical protein